jgi:hypothetical protein
MKTFLTNEPVLATTIARVAGYLVAILVVAGVVTAEQETALLNAIGTIAPVAALLLDAVLAWFARSKVTPVANPFDDDGNPLTPDSVFVP